MNKHDRLLKELIRELDLTTNIGIGSQPTFFYQAHNSKSQIDYILTTNKDMIKGYTISEKGVINISAHVPVTITPKNIRQHKLVKQKIVWNQIDNEKYNENFTANLKDIDDFQNSELKIQKITEAILLA
jgi:predicted metal-dependent RNase